MDLIENLNVFPAGDTTPPATGSAEGKVTDIARWGDFEVHFDQLIGRGGMGSVYRSRQRSLDRWVAVKVLDAERAPDPSLRDAFLQKFRIEIQVLSRLRDPRIVTILQAGEDDGRIWFAMELIEGRTLERRLFDEGAIPEAEARRIGAEVARALDAAWRQGIIHRDVKPGNIFLLPDGSVKLADFGLARSAEFGKTRLTEVNALACTPAYAAPELVDGSLTDPRSDLYSLGCVLYEMVTERPPFPGESQMSTLFRHSEETPRSPRLLNPSVSEDFEGVVLRCLEKDLDARYSGYPELVVALEPKASPLPPRTSWSWPAATAAGMAILGALLTAIFTHEEPQRPPVPAAILKPAEAPPPRVEKQPVVSEPPPAAAPRQPTPLEILSQAPTDEDVQAVESLFVADRRTLADREAGRWEAVRASLEACARSVKLTPSARLIHEGGLERLRSAAAGELGPLARAAAGDATEAAGDVAALEASEAARHVPGVLDQAVEEALRWAERGDFDRLRRSERLEAWGSQLQPLLGSRFRLLQEERGAALLLGREEGTGELLSRRLGTIAGRRAAGEVLSAFRSELPVDELHQLVGEVPFGGWAHDLDDAPEGRIAYDHALKCYVLSAPEGQRSWIKKPFRGAAAGYEIRYRTTDLVKPVVSVALSTSRWIEIGERSASLWRKDAEGRREKAEETRLEAHAPSARLTVLPRASRVLVYLDERLLFSLSEADYRMDGGMKIGAGGGAILIDSIRVKDRTR
jgi:serine/threonine protein kinase